MRALITFFTIIFPMSAMTYLFLGDIITQSYQTSMQSKEVEIPIKIIKVNINDEIEKPTKREPDPKQESVPIVKDPMVAIYIEPIDPKYTINSDGCLQGMHFIKSDTGVPLECVPDDD